MAHIADEVATIHSKVQRKLTSIEAVHLELRKQIKLLAEIGDEEGMLDVCLVQGQKDKRMGTQFVLPALIVCRYLAIEIERLSGNLREQIEPLRYLLEEEDEPSYKPQTPAGEALLTLFGLAGTKNTTAEAGGQELA